MSRYEFYGFFIGSRGGGLIPKANVSSFRERNEGL